MICDCSRSWVSIFEQYHERKYFECHFSIAIGNRAHALRNVWLYTLHAMWCLEQYVRTIVSEQRKRSDTHNRLQWISWNLVIFAINSFAVIASGGILLCCVCSAIAMRGICSLCARWIDQLLALRCHTMTSTTTLKMIVSTSTQSASCCAELVYTAHGLSIGWKVGGSTKYIHLVWDIRKLR